MGKTQLCEEKGTPPLCMWCWWIAQFPIVKPRSLCRSQVQLRDNAASLGQRKMET